MVMFKNKLVILLCAIPSVLIDTKFAKAAILSIFKFCLPDFHN